MTAGAGPPQPVVIAVVGAERRAWLFAPPGASTADARETVAGVLATMHVDMDIDRRLVRLVDLLTRVGCRPCEVATARMRYAAKRGWHLPGPAEPVHRPNVIAVRWGRGRQYFAVPAEGRWRSTLAAFHAAAAEHAAELNRLYGEVSGDRATAVERVSAIYAARGFPTLRVVTVRCGPLGIDDTEAVNP